MSDGLPQGRRVGRVRAALRCRNQTVALGQRRHDRAKPVARNAPGPHAAAQTRHVVRHRSRVAHRATDGPEAGAGAQAEDGGARGERGEGGGEWPHRERGRVRGRRREGATGTNFGIVHQAGRRPAV